MDADRPTLDEIEVTPEMIEAGEIAFCEFEPLSETRAEAVARIYREMVKVSRSQNKI